MNFKNFKMKFSSRIPSWTQFFYRSKHTRKKYIFIEFFSVIFSIYK